VLELVAVGADRKVEHRPLTGEILSQLLADRAEALVAAMPDARTAVLPEQQHNVDPTVLEQILGHLLDNATKYAPVNTLIRITARRLANEMIEISVADEGPGIPVPLRDNVFDKFFSTTQTTSHGLARPAGIGLGLAIARGIVSAHGGTIDIKSEVGKGTSVRIYLPIDERPTESDLYEGNE